MRYKPLGRTTDSIPAIGQGTRDTDRQLSADEVDDREQVRLMRLGIDLGMTLIDTAEGYASGHAEELVREAKVRRLASKDIQFISYGTREWFHSQNSLDIASVVDTISHGRSEPPLP